MIQNPYIENLRTRAPDDANMDWKMEKDLQKQKEVELKAMEELYKEQKALQREQFAMLVADRFETDCKSQTVAEDAVHAAQLTVTSVSFLKIIYIIELFTINIYSRKFRRKH